MKGKGLGTRGLASLIGAGTTDKEILKNDDAFNEIEIERLQRGKYQPRQEFDKESLEDLARSIQKQGIMQPIVVRPIDSECYEIIAGERRWRGAQLAGLKKVPVTIKHVDDESALAMALIENIQREDLNVMEEAFALQKLQDVFGLSQQEVADSVGKSRSTVTNILRLINLCDEVKTKLQRGELEMGHGRAILPLNAEQQIEIANQISNKGLSVRQTEAMVRKYMAEAEDKPFVKAVILDKDFDTRQTVLAAKIGTRIDIKHTDKGNGKLVINYDSPRHLDIILKLMEK